MTTERRQFAEERDKGKRMQERIQAMELSRFTLFHGIDGEAEQILKCSGCLWLASFERTQTVLHSGQRIGALGLVLSGGLYIERTDFWGNRSILSSVEPGQFFAETYVLAQEPMLVDVTAAKSSELLFLDLERLRNSQHAKIAGVSQIMENLLQISVQKNLILSQRIFCTTPKTVRGRLLVYLSNQAEMAGSHCFEIPFDRQGLADYLNLDRSALSKELGRMRDEGILSFQKNRFELKRMALPG